MSVKVIDDLISQRNETKSQFSHFICRILLTTKFKDPKLTNVSQNTDMVTNKIVNIVLQVDIVILQICYFISKVDVCMICITFILY